MASFYQTLFISKHQSSSLKRIGLPEGARGMPPPAAKKSRRRLPAGQALASMYSILSEISRSIPIGAARIGTGRGVGWAKSARQQSPPWVRIPFSIPELALSFISLDHSPSRNVSRSDGKQVWVPCQPNDVRLECSFPQGRWARGLRKYLSNSASDSRSRVVFPSTSFS